MTTLEGTSTSIKRGDLAPDLVYYARDDAHEADLTQVVSWRLLAVDAATGAVVFTDTAPILTVPDAAQPWRVALLHLWQTTETATVRRLIVEAEATWPGGKVQTFPRVVVNIEPRLI